MARSGFCMRCEIRGVYDGGMYCSWCKEELARIRAAREAAEQEQADG